MRKLNRLILFIALIWGMNANAQNVTVTYSNNVANEGRASTGSSPVSSYSYNFAPPSTTTNLTVGAYGGGAGSGGISTGGGHAGGGGGGGYISFTYGASTSFNINGQVGGGGARGEKGSNCGSNGAESNFRNGTGNYCRAYGGTRGSYRGPFGGGDNACSGVGGTTTNNGHVNNNGYAGGGQGSGTGGGGGRAGGPNGGDGGPFATNWPSDCVGRNGFNPGGGGGSGYSGSEPGGHGGGGRVIITFTLPVPTIGTGTIPLCGGDRLELSVLNPTAGATYTWFRGGTQVQSSTSTTYVVTSVTNTNEGDYTVRASMPFSGSTTGRSISTSGGITVSGNNFLATSGARRVTVCTFTQPNPAATHSEICYGTSSTTQGGLASSINLAAATTSGTCSGSISYRWEQSSNGTSGWTTAPGGNTGSNPAYNLPVLYNQTYFRRVAVHTGVCRDLTSTVIRVPVSTQFTQPNPPGTFAGNPICYGTGSATITLGAATGGSGTGPTYNWQQRTVGGTWGPADGTRNQQNYTTPTLTRDMEYRRQATRGTCGGTIETTVIRVTVTEQFRQNNQDGETICYGGTATLNKLGAATGGTGTLSYNWQQRTVGGTWGNAIGTRNQADYTTPALTVTMEYRRQAIRTGCGGTIETNPIRVTVTEELRQNSPTPATSTICYEKTQVLTLAAATGGGSGLAYQWQQRPVGGMWTDIPGATGINYTTLGLVEDTEFRRMARTTLCGWVPSTEALVKVYPIFNPGQILPGARSACTENNEDIVIIPSVTPATGGDGNITYQWYKAVNGGTPTAIPVNTSNICPNRSDCADYRIPEEDLSFSGTIEYTRKAKDGTCETTFK